MEHYNFEVLDGGVKVVVEQRVALSDGQSYMVADQ